MVKIGFPSYLSKLILSFLEKRSFQTKIDGVLSDVAYMVAGLPQGSVESPTLYSIYTSDFPSPRDCTVAQYADDTAAFALAIRGEVAKKRVQKALNQFDKYFKKWRIRMNPEKFEAIFFSRRRKSSYFPQTQFSSSDILIPWSSSIKYLGVHLQKNLTFQNHIRESISKVEKTTKILFPLIGRRSKLSIKNKLLLYKTIFRPVLSYAVPVWNNCAITLRKKLQVCQNKVLKLCLNRHWRTSTALVHDEAEIELLSDHLNKIVTRFRLNCSVHDNQEISGLDFSL